MKIPSKIMAVRLERATELETFARLLDKIAICDGTYLVYGATTILRDKTKGFHSPNTNDYACWGYSIENLILRPSELPKRHIRPSSIHTIQVEIDVELLCNDKHWIEQNDPFISLNFRARITGSDSRNKYSFGFHIDRHNQNDQSEEIHPVYHLQYNPFIDDDSKLGSVLYLDTPRVMHVPLDLILGVDMILSNFAPKAWEALRNENEYQSLYRKYQNSLWKPYIHSWASHWPNRLQSVSWQPQSICPYLLT